MTGRNSEVSKRRNYRKRIIFYQKRTFLWEITSYLFKVTLALLVIWLGGEFFLFLDIPQSILARVAGGLIAFTIFFLFVIIPWETKGG